MNQVNNFHYRLTDLGSVLAPPESNPNIHGATPLSALVAATSPGHHMDPESTPHKVLITTNTSRESAQIVVSYQEI